MLDVIESLSNILALVVFPLIVYAFKQNSRMVVLETKQLSNDELKESIGKIFDKLDEIKNEIHELDEKYISQKTCDFRHKK